MADSGMIRGYSIKKTADFLRSDYFDAATREKMLAQLPERLRGDLSKLDVAAWYPREDSAVLYRAMVSSTRTESEARKLLVRCGESIADESMNTFLKLVMKLMNPVRFANKLPSLWERDMKGGHFRVDVSRASDKRIGFVLADVEDYDHIGPVTEGWLRVAMKAMGETGVEVDIGGWSLATPGPREVSYEMRWA